MEPEESPIPLPPWGRQFCVYVHFFSELSQTFDLIIAVRISLNTPTLIWGKGKIYKQFPFLDPLAVIKNVLWNRIYVMLIYTQFSLPKDLQLTK